MMMMVAVKSAMLYSLEIFSNDAVISGLNCENKSQLIIAKFYLCLKLMVEGTRKPTHPT